MVDAIVTFSSHDFDWSDLLKKVKPGGSLILFNDPGTSHRITCEIEDAGWTIKDVLCWLYESEWTPIIWAIRPPEKTFLDNILKHQVGVINVNECRIGTGLRQATAGNIGFGKDRDDNYIKGTGAEYTTEGRFPANLIFTHSPDCVQVGARTNEVDGEIETVEVWNCVPGCSVESLNSSKKDEEPSRFFFCSETPEEVFEWLVKMVTKEGQSVLSFDPVIIEAINRTGREVVPNE